MTIKSLGFIRIRTTIFLCMAIFCNCAFGQIRGFNLNLKSEKIRAFNLKLKRFNVKFTMPKGFVLIDSSIDIIDGITGHVTAGSGILLKSLDGHMAIGISFQGPIDTLKRNFIMSNGELYDPNKNYLPFNQKFTFFDKRFSKTNYNADVAGTWDLVPFRKIPILSVDEECRVVIMHKENVVDIEIYNFYRGLSKKDLDHQMKRLIKMVKFKKKPKSEVNER